MFKWQEFGISILAGLFFAGVLGFGLMGKLHNAEQYDPATVRMFAKRIGIGIAVGLPLLDLCFQWGVL